MRHVSIMLSSNLGFIFYFFFSANIKGTNPFYAVRGVYLKMPVDELFCKQSDLFICNWSVNPNILYYFNQFSAEIQNSVGIGFKMERQLIKSDSFYLLKKKVSKELRSKPKMTSNT